MQDKDLISKLSLLGYTPAWLDSGILTLAQLEGQIQYYNSGEDDNLEHYRYKTLHHYINSHPHLSDQDLRQVLNFIQSEPDKAMAASVAIFLLKKAYLTETQFEKVCGLLRQYGEWTEKEITKQSALR